MSIPTQKRIVLENERVRLSPLKEQHFDDLLPIALAYPNLLQYSPALFGSASHLRAYIKQALAQRVAQVKYPFVIYDKRAQAIAGSTSFMNIVAEHQRVEIGATWLSKPFHGTGLNSHCKFLMLQYAFEKTDIIRIKLKTDSRNIISQKAILKIGATYEGMLRSHILMPDGYRRDSLYYSILRKEWASVKARLKQQLTKPLLV